LARNSINKQKFYSCLTENSSLDNTYYNMFWMTEELRFDSVYRSIHTGCEANLASSSLSIGFFPVI